MGQRNMLYLVAILFIFSFITGCTQDGEQPEEQGNEEVEQANAADEETEETIDSIQLTAYAEEVGFSLASPEQDHFTANTTVRLEGTITEADDLTGEYLWIVITAEEPSEELPGNEFSYYVKIEDGAFSRELNLHQGAGEYEVNVRAPSNQSNEEDVYYETAAFQVTNEDEDIAREVEYTEYGVLNDVQLHSPVLGWGQHDEGIVFIEGSVPEDHPGDMVLVQVEKDNEDRQIIFPIEDGEFQGEVPLYFGEGLHHVRVQSFNETEDLYYEAASFYADHQGEAAFAEIEKFNQYIDRGVTLHAPAWSEDALQTNQEYRIAGEIDPDMPGADAISHIIVTVINLDAEEEAGYVIPVEDYHFDGLAYFRFGPGNYEVIVNVPDDERQDQSMFYFEGVARIQHEVADIPDERGTLPSRGIESDHPSIIEKAEEITANLTSDREKARAVYQFVAQHVAYDVEKAEADIFNIDDSALSTLESGIGICQDYAFLATALFRSIGMEAHYVEGYAGERHAWVEVMVDGEWLEMDPTWGAGYVQDGEFHFHYNEDYFDPDPAFLAETHTREGIMY